MYQQPVGNKPTAAYYLTLIGGILGIIIGIFLIFIIIGIWIIIANVITIVFAQRLMNEPHEHSKWGILIVIFAVLSGLNLLSLIGGILALTFAPIPSQTTAPPYTYPTYPQPPPTTATKYCSQCGAAVNLTDKYCPHCGNPL